jgi:2-succinyl-6-hydroxy-2,4-cyclohexadiene-1-carboxylate synthase
MPRPTSSSRYLVHGFTQVPASWGPVTEALDAVAVDAPVASLWDAADQLAALGTGTWIGYSMGGRVALHLALAHPRCVEGLVLVSATAGIDDPDERRARVESDEALAHRAEQIGAGDFVTEWLARPMFAGVPPVPRSDDVATMAAHLRLAGVGVQEPLWDRLGELTMPVLVVAGERDAKFVALGERLASGITGAVLEIVPGAGHAVPFEQPDAFVAAVRRWSGH